MLNVNFYVEVFEIISGFDIFCFDYQLLFRLFFDLEIRIMSVTKNYDK